MKRRTPEELTSRARVEKKGRLCETTCAEHFGDSVDKADDLIGTEDDVIGI